jgi:hypothetical protein
MRDSKKRFVHSRNVDEVTKGIRSDNHPADEFTQNGRLLQVSLKHFPEQLCDQQHKAQLCEKVSRSLN